MESVGIDLVRIDRMEQHIDDPKFMARIFTTRELRENLSRTDNAADLASHWAVKEATAKALGCGIGESLYWKDVELLHDENGQPRVELSIRAKEIHNQPKLVVSLA